jgi:glucose/mannose-6-phosphate isomerase
MNHNEIQGWKHPAAGLQQLIPIFLRDKEDHTQVQARADITRQLVGDQAEVSLEFWTEGESWLERLWSLILLGDWASLYLAFLNRENPTPVAAIEDFKKRLKEQTAKGT